MEVLNNAVEALNDGTARIKFEKADGSIRELYGTRNGDLIPEAFTPTLNEGLNRAEARAANENVVTVFDLEANGWRSFRKDKFLSFKTDAYYGS